MEEVVALKWVKLGVILVILIAMIAISRRHRAIARGTAVKQAGATAADVHRNLALVAPPHDGRHPIPVLGEDQGVGAPADRPRRGGVACRGREHAPVEEDMGHEPPQLTEVVIRHL